MITGQAGEYVIQALPSAEEGNGNLISVPLGLFAGKDGLYTFSVPLNENTGNAGIYIRDMEMGQVSLLDSTHHYSVGLAAGEYSQRFFLLYNYKPSSVNDLLPQNQDFEVYSSANKLIVKSKLENSRVFCTCIMPWAKQSGYCL